jgi:Protein of unknown function (DUF4230)
MKRFIVTFFLFLAVLITGYYFGQKQNKDKTVNYIIDNRQFAKEIAEISSLEITGNQTVKFTNIGQDASFYNRMKKYFYENTLDISVPFIAKYGISLQDKDFEITKITSDSIHVHLPDCTLKSLQLEMDKLVTSSHTGFFNFSSIEDLKEAQKVLYTQANVQLQQNGEYLQKARNNIIHMLTSYYAQAGIKAKIYIKNSKGVKE